MSKTRVFNTLVDSLNRPVKGVKISASVMRSSFVSGSTHEYYENATTVTDSLGYWELSLTPNQELNPGLTYYAITEGGKSRWACIVPVAVVEGETSLPVHLPLTIIQDLKYGLPVLDGDKGPRGDKGPSGDAAQVFVEDPFRPGVLIPGVLGGNSSVVVTKGDRGPQGNPGPVGPIGPKGDPGTGGSGSGGGDQIVIEDPLNPGLYTISNDQIIVPDPLNDGLFILEGGSN